MSVQVIPLVWGAMQLLALSEVNRLARFRRRRRSDLLALALLLLVALALLSPALKDGFAFGPFDFDLSLSALTHGQLRGIHSPYNGDAVSQMVAWNTLDWRMIHHGQFPLWNSYSGLGMPQFLNFESSVLSLPDLVSYLFPLNAAFSVVVLMKLLIAGSGAYLLARVLRLRPIAALFAGVTFMCSGAFASWVTWPLSDVAAWSGWILGLALLVLRGEGPRATLAALAVAVAFSIYGGFPEGNVLFGIVALVVLVVYLALTWVRDRWLPLRATVRLVGASAVGIAAAAPLWLPGLEIIAAAHRTSEGHYAALPLRSMPLLFSQGFYGLPFGSNDTLFQLHHWNYYETVAYVGIVALVLALLAILGGWREPIVVALTTALVVAVGIAYQPADFHPLQSLLNSSPTLAAVRFERIRVFVDFLLAILGAYGLHYLVVRFETAGARRRFGLSTTLGAALVSVSAALTLHERLSAVARAERIHALIWPLGLSVVLIGAALVTLAPPTPRRAQLVAGVLLVAETSFLVFSGVGLYTYTANVFPTTPAVQALAARVGGALVGLDGGNTTNVRAFSHIGFYPNVNIGYGVRLFGIHDPLIPKSYFASWPFPSAAPEAGGVGLFVPAINSVPLAQRYGISYVLVAPGLSVPTGMVPVATIAGERLVAVPESTTFSYANPRTGSVSRLALGANGAATMVAKSAQVSEFVFHLTYLPGWHVTVDGRPATLLTVNHVMFGVVLPAGTHHLSVNYWPRPLTEGIAIALIALVLLVLSVMMPMVSSPAWLSVHHRRGDHTMIESTPEVDRR